MGNLIKGQDFNFYVKINGYNMPVARATNGTLTFTAEATESTTKNGLKGKTYIYQGKYGYTLSVEGISNLIDVANFGYFQTALLESGKLDFIFTDNLNAQYTGTVLVTDAELDTPAKAMSTFKNTLLGDGEIVPIFYDVPVTPPGSSVQIIDQFGDVLASVLAPGSYSVLRFDTIDEGSASTVESDYQIVIIQAA